MSKNKEETLSGKSWIKEKPVKTFCSPKGGGGGVLLRGGGGVGRRGMEGVGTANFQ